MFEYCTTSKEQCTLFTVQRELPVFQNDRVYSIKNVFLFLYFRIWFRIVWMFKISIIVNIHKRTYTLHTFSIIQRACARVSNQSWKKRIAVTWTWYEKKVILRRLQSEWIGCRERGKKYTYIKTKKYIHFAVPPTELVNSLKYLFIFFQISVYYIQSIIYSRSRLVDGKGD